MTVKAIQKNWVVGPFQCNCRLIVCEETGEAALIDPGDEAEKILRNLEGVKTSSGVPLKLRYLLHTHGHLDHVGASRKVRESRGEGPKISMHRGDEPLYLQLIEQGRLFGLKYDQPLPIDEYLEDTQEIRVGRLLLSVLHTPGHSPGSVCIRMHEDSEGGVLETVFSGDTLFQGSVGRTDLWGGDQDQMFKSIRQRLLVLDGDTRICPGHGPDTTVGTEKLKNPFLI
ncbi:MAG: MBL fold metallo-hydrolase [Bdellovibrionales bacterium]|nr:MBL fold metallo-hydrolase [Bdellovibrionales bacterium]